MNREKTKQLLTDLAKTTALSCLAAAAASLLAFLAGTVFSAPGGGLETAKNTCFFLAALLLFLLAGLIMGEGKKPRGRKERAGLSRHGKVLPLRAMAAIAAAVFVLFGVAFDLLIRYR